MTTPFCSDYIEMETVKYKTDILHITATCFGYMKMPIIRPKHGGVMCKINVVFNKVHELSTVCLP